MVYHFLWVICWLDEAHIPDEGRVRQITSTCVGYEGRQVILLRRTWNLLIVITGEGRTIRIYFFLSSCIPRPSLVFFFPPVLSSLGHHIPPSIFRAVGNIPWRRERIPTPVFWPGEFHGLYSPWGCKELDMTERLSLFFGLFWYPAHVWLSTYFPSQVFGNPVSREKGQ